MTGGSKGWGQWLPICPSRAQRRGGAWHTRPGRRCVRYEALYAKLPQQNDDEEEEECLQERQGIAAGREHHVRAAQGQRPVW